MGKASAAHRYETLRKAKELNRQGWLEYTVFHWVREMPEGTLLHWWPSTMRAIEYTVDGGLVHDWGRIGPRKMMAFLEKRCP